MVGRLGDYDIDTITLPDNSVEWQASCFRCNFVSQTSRTGPLLTYKDVYITLTEHICDPSKKTKIGPIVL